MSMKIRLVSWILTAYLLAALFAAFIIVKNMNVSTNNSSYDDGNKLKRLMNNNNNNLFQHLRRTAAGASPSYHRNDEMEHNYTDVDFTFESNNDKRYWDQWAPINSHHLNISFSQNLKPRISNQASYVVDIWSNNGLGEYLWEHVMQGELRSRPDNLYRHGEKTINRIKYRYKGGKSLSIGFLPDGTEHVILVLNGRSNSTVEDSKSWLDGLVEFDALQNVGLVLIGDELCRNEWLFTYLHHKNASSPKFVFLVYDSPHVDGDTIHQFPLGVATYRNFPLALFPDLVVGGQREYICNFMGTVYPNSSREVLVKILNNMNTSHTHLCYLKARQVWQAEETAAGLSSYLKVLKTSDLTLCPVGMNSESYRIYEAMSLGSVPVVEDVVVNATCSSVPYRLLRLYKAPVIYVKHWSELPSIIDSEQRMSLTAKERRREEVIGWYKRFRRKMADIFTGTVGAEFFDIR